MADLKPLVPVNKNQRARVVIFLSGSGSNACRILERWQQDETPIMDIVALVTDRPDKSRAIELGETFGLPVIASDIREFYRRHNCKRVTIATEEGRRIRALWTDALIQQLDPLALDFGLFAGFVPLTNLTNSLPCLNVHPGDLTFLQGGERYLVGLHTVPIERAILEGLDHLRTSVILAESYSGKGDDMDSGPILGISSKVMLDLQGHSLEELSRIAAARPDSRPVGGYKDLLETVAEHNQELLKEGGDWVVFPPVVWDVAQGKFGLKGSQLMYKHEGEWLAVRTVEYDGKDATPIA